MTTPATAQHTPGPWHGRIGEHGAWYGTGRDGGPLLHGDHRTPEEIAANEALLEAAPYLLAALEQMVAHSTVKLGASVVDYASTISHARAAIRKAKGE